jgi:preprotein translocase subunit YajC
VFFAFCASAIGRGLCEPLTALAQGAASGANSLASEVSLNPAQFSERAAAEAAAANPTPAQPGFGEVLFKMLPMFAMVFLIFYFMVIKPQQQKLRDQDNLLKGLKKGDTVVTSGGIIARFIGIEGDAALVEPSPNNRLRIEPSHIAKRYEPKKEPKKEGTNSEDEKSSVNKADKKKPAA